MKVRAVRHGSWLHRWRGHVPELGWWSVPVMFRWSALLRAELAVRRHRSTIEREV